MKSCLIIILLLSVPLFSKNISTKITGTVKSLKTFQPLNHAEVFISDTTLGTTTDQNGFYEISDIPAGKNTVVVVLTGYESQSK